MLSFISPDDDDEEIFLENKERLLEEADIEYLGDNIYLESHLRQCYDDSPRLYLRKIRKKDLADFRISPKIVDDENEGALRFIPSKEILQYDSSDEVLEEQVIIPEETKSNDQPQKVTNPSYKKIMKKLRKMPDVPMAINIPSKKIPPPSPIPKITPPQPKLTQACQTDPKSPSLGSCLVKRTITKELCIDIHRNKSKKLSNIQGNYKCKPKRNVNGFNKKMPLLKHAKKRHIIRKQITSCHAKFKNTKDEEKEDVRKIRSSFKKTNALDENKGIHLGNANFGTWVFHFNTYPRQETIDAVYDYKIEDQKSNFFDNSFSNLEPEKITKYFNSDDTGKLWNFRNQSIGETFEDNPKQVQIYYFNSRFKVDQSDTNLEVLFINERYGLPSKKPLLRNLFSDVPSKEIPQLKPNKCFKCGIACDNNYILLKRNNICKVNYVTVNAMVNRSSYPYKWNHQQRKIEIRRTKSCSYEHDWPIPKPNHDVNCKCLFCLLNKMPIKIGK